MKYFDDDMDELFNKAGRQYPLKTDPKNWDAVQGALAREQGTADTAQKSRSYRRFLPILLLLLIPAVYVFIDKDNVKGSASGVSEKENKVVTKGVAANTNEKEKERENKNADKKNIALNVKENKINTSINKEQNQKNSISKSELDKNKIELNKNRPEQNKNNSQSVTKEKRSKNSFSSFSFDKNKENKNKNINLITKSNKNIQSLNLEKNKSSQTLSLEKNHPIIEKNKSTQSLITKNNHSISLNTNNIISKNKLILNNKNLNNKNSVDPMGWTSFPPLNRFNQEFDEISVNTPLKSLSHANESKSVPPIAKKKQNKNGLYYGVVLAPDITTIKGQQVKKVGYSIGILTGYNITNHWAIEAGILWSKKNYYSDGKYFDKKGASIPYSVIVNWVDGNCQMFEFPVQVRYNLSKKPSTFFATAGLTSFLMKKEEYDYSAQAGPGQNPSYGYKSFDRTGDHLFADVQLSAGYNYSLSSKLNIRIEPYLKMPLKKVGIGKMPITSTGLFFGITRDIR